MYNYNKDFEKIKYGKKNKSRKAPTHKVYQQICDFETGEIIYEQEISVKKSQAKKGWCKMYMRDLKDALLILSKNTTAQKIWIYLWDKFKKDGTIKMPKNKDIAKELNIRPETVSRALKFLRKEEIIEKIDGEWRYNPFIFGVANQSDAELHEAQKIWEEYIGHYNYYKDKK